MSDYKILVGLNSSDKTFAKNKCIFLSLFVSKNGNILAGYFKQKASQK